MALKLCIFFLSALLCSPFILKQKGGAIAISSSGNLGFGNQTGSGVVAGQVSAFINYINSASTFYRDDIESKLKYISDQMNTAYGRSGYSYSVYLAYDYDYSWSIYNYFSVFASVAPGVDRIYPRHSYMFVLQYNYGSRDYLLSCIRYVRSSVLPRSKIHLHQTQGMLLYYLRKLRDIDSKKILNYQTLFDIHYLSLIHGIILMSTLSFEAESCLLITGRHLKVA
jgi:hypothetical protein